MIQNLSVTNSMKLTINRAELVSALSKLSTVIPGRAVNLATFGFEFNVDTVVTITATNLTYSARTKLNPESVEGTDTFILPAHRILAALSQMVDDTIEISRQNWRNFVELKDSQFQMRMSVIAERMPETNLDSDYDELCRVPSDWLKKSLELVYFAAPKNAVAHPNLCGILIEVGDGEIFVHAARGTMAACRCMALESDALKNRIVIPLPSVRIVHGIIGGDGECELKTSATRLYLKSDGFELLCPLVVNPYPNVKVMFSRCADSPTAVETSVADLKKMMDRAMLLQVSDTETLELSVKLQKEKIEFSGETTAGSLTDSIPCTLDGERVDFMFDAALLNPLIQTLVRNGSEDCTLLVSTGTSPALFSSGDFRALIMPLGNKK